MWLGHSLPRVASQDKSTSLLPVVPPAQPTQPPLAVFSAAHQIELEKQQQQLCQANIEEKISLCPGMMNPTEGPVYSLPLMSINVPRPGSMTPSIMQDMQPGQWSTAQMPQQSSMQQNIHHPVIEMTAAQKAVAGSQLQGVCQQQACNISPNALQDLLQTLKASSSPRQQQQVLNTPQSNPQLMAGFINKRTANYVANQSGMQYPQPVASPAPGTTTQQPSTSQTMQPAPQPSPSGMASLGSPNENETQSMNPQESHKPSIQSNNQVLVHACKCRNANCSLPSCQKMKRVVQHTKGCKRKTNGDCPVCKQLIALCCYHAKHCQESKCPVLFCFKTKHKLRQQQIQQRLQQAQLMRQQRIQHRLQQAARNTHTQGQAKG